MQQHLIKSAMFFQMILYSNFRTLTHQLVETLQSPRCTTISVDDTNDPRHGPLLAYCYRWWSKTRNNTIRGRNILERIS